MTLHGKSDEGSEARLFHLRTPEPTDSTEPARLLRLATSAPAASGPIDIPAHSALLPNRPLGKSASVVPFVQGRTLAAHLAASGPLAAEQVEVVIAVVGDALATLHRSGLVHLDIKPDNIMVASTGELVVVDTARITEAHGSPIRRGTPPFTVPGAPASPATDWVALGRTALFLATANPITPIEQIEVRLREPIGRMLGGDPSGIDGHGDDRLHLATFEAVAPHHRPTIDFGPYTGAQEPAASRSHRPSAVLVVTAILLATALGAWTTTRQNCPDAAAVSIGQPVEVDVGERCPAIVHFDDSTGVLSVWSGDGPNRFGIGEPGDEIVFGDWNCDTTITPGLRRGAQLLVFDHWPGAEPEAARPLATEPSC